MESYRRTKDQAWENTDKLKLAFMFLSFFPKCFLSKEFAFWVTPEKTEIRPIFLFWEFSISSYENV